ncbi:hypothetical protein P4O66_000565 [Electrophorus voltai]|uniref:Uncharacterized protein n=1 Tax=Electrophorus voltai TaxID=2609070 RepID=A0AAD8ZFF4_9TELE|nr:hypothetical protein P4O66_000565 [Electrophorus voltai]
MEDGLSDEQCSEQLEPAHLELLQLCEQKCEQQELACVRGKQVDQYLLRWQMLLSAHSMQLSELITLLDQEAAIEICKMLLFVLQVAVAEARLYTSLTSPIIQHSQCCSDPKTNSSPDADPGNTSLTLKESKNELTN